MSWSELVVRLEKLKKENRALINSLRQSAKSLIGDESSIQAVEECAVFLFLQFVEIQEVTLRDVNALKKQFGKGDLSLAKKIQKVIVASSHKPLGNI